MEEQRHELLRPTWLEIDLEAIAHNMREIRRLAKSPLVCAVIKANGYGHGAVAIGATLLRNGADRFAVATADEALELRRAFPEVPILVLGEITDAAVGRLAEAGVAVEVSSKRRALEFERILSGTGGKLLVHIKLDTGMGRIGFPACAESIDSAVEDVLSLRDLPHLRIEGVFSHFARADEADKTFTMLQLERFRKFNEALAAGGLTGVIRHLANSPAILDHPEAHFDMVRAGIILYGLRPSDDVHLERIHLKPAMSLFTRVVFVKDVPADFGIGYGHLFRTGAPAHIATLPIGYADGIERRLTNKLFVLHRGKRVPQRGRVCMDQIMIEAPDAQVGDEIVLFGRQGEGSITIDEYAEWCGTNNYEAACSMGPRIPRVYLPERDRASE